MKLLTAIFSYNRYYLLKNAIESFYEFGPDSDLLVVDDGSSDSRIREYLEHVKKEKGAAVIVSTSHIYGFHGGLYENMNRAVEYALARDYTHIFFVQDDMQFMWEDESFLQRVKGIFDGLTDAAMILPVFQKGIVQDTFKERFEVHPNWYVWHLKPYGICDLGIMPLSLIKKHKWGFGESEGKNGQIWRELGYKLYVTTTPIIAWVPWPQVKKFNKIFGSERKPMSKYFLKPLTKEQIQKLEGQGVSAIPCHEDFCFPWGWRCLSPYWFTHNRGEYIKLILKGILKGRYPKIVCE